MSKFIMYKLKDGRRIRGRYDHDTDKVLISCEDLEGLLNESDVAYEQAKQLQTIIENLEEIKAEAARKAVNKIRVEIKNDWQLKKYPSSPFSCGLGRAIEIIDKYRTESEDRVEYGTDGNAYRLTISNGKEFDQDSKTGHWVRITKGAIREKYICSWCGRIIEDCNDEYMLTIRYPYCHCGCRMVAPWESEEEE